MEFDEETIRQILLALVAVAVFVAALVVVGQTYATSNGAALSATGGLAMIGLLAGFILLMALVGLWLERQEFDS
jgi:hypothetical protein